MTGVFVGVKAEGAQKTRVLKCFFSLVCTVLKHLYYKGKTFYIFSSKIFYEKIKTHESNSKCKDVNEYKQNEISKSGNFPVNEYNGGIICF